MASLPSPESLPFPAHARAAVGAVRGAFAELLWAAGADPHEPQSISRQLGLNKNLAWKLAKIVQAEEPAVVLEQMPGAAGIEIFFRSVERLGIEPAARQAARAAVDEFERLIRVHSGDRATLEMMGSELSSTGRAQRDEQHRKLLFQGASYVWGAQARINLKVGIVGPGSAPGTLDFASLSGLIDFRRLRPDVRWVMAARHLNNDDGTPLDGAVTESLDPAWAGEDRAPLMAAFCSRPLPELRRVREQTSTCFELTEGPVGNTGAVTCVVGTVQRRLPRIASVENVWGEHSAKCDIPAELMLLDLFVHRDHAFAIPPEIELYSGLSGSAVPPGPVRDRNRLPLNEPLRDLGAGVPPPLTPEVPRYTQMVHAAFGRVGWRPEEFHGFRMRIAYPPYPAVFVLRYALPGA